MENTAQAKLCPICGESVEIIGSTTDGRLIGSCRDAFTAKQWNSEEIAWAEYDGAAAELARKGLKGAIGDPLPNLMSAEAVELINADPEAFERRVRAFAYALAMGESIA